MNKLIQSKNSSENIISDFEKFKQTYEAAVDEHFADMKISQELGGIASLDKKVLALELNLQNLRDNFQKDIKLLSVELTNLCEKNTLRTDTNEDNIEALDTNYQELGGQLNQVRMELNEVKKTLEEQKQRKNSFRDYLFYPLLLSIILGMLGYLGYLIKLLMNNIPS